MSEENQKTKSKSKKLRGNKSIEESKIKIDEDIINKIEKLKNGRK